MAGLYLDQHSADARYARRGHAHEGGGEGGGVTDHGALTGLDEDDHAAIYLNNTRGDARYAPIVNAFPARLWITADATNPSGSVDGDFRVRPA
jgi:hypothetical protein